MSDFILEREIKNLQGDLNMTKMAIMSVQNDMVEQLSGEMGEDINAVLSGERIVKAGVVERRKYKVKSWFKRLFRLF